MHIRSQGALGQPRRLPFWQRALFAVPVLGWIARDVVHGDAENFWYALGLFLSCWGCSILLFGLPGLYIPAVVSVPLIFVLLLMITWD